MSRYRNTENKVPILSIFYSRSFYRADGKAKDYGMNGSRSEGTNYDIFLSNIIQHVTHLTRVLQQRKDLQKTLHSPQIDLLLIYSCMKF